MKRVEHLKDSFGYVLFHRHPGAKGPRFRRCVENDRRQISLGQALVQGVANLAHHRDVEDIERWPREGDPRDPVVNPEFDVLKFFGHPL
jgi:hypothetical protein